MDWPGIENAIRSWVVGASGLAAGQVVFSNQHAGAPEGDYVTVEMGAPVRKGGAAGEILEFDPDADAGQEIILSTFAPATLMATISAYTIETSGSGSAVALLSKTQAALDLGLYRDPINAAGMGVLDAGTIQSVPAVFGAAMEGRAVLEVIFSVWQDAQARTGYIASVDVTDDLSHTRNVPLE